ncbi:MAG TPA: sulfite exporter TauE/SafE family protein [Arenibaculum sp.]|nr:sulfite exporter TauE/SafE family protein [Arenibaculum sp.]
MDPNAFLAALLDAGLAHCSALVERDGLLVASLFLTGLVGSATHCAGMCGGFVLAQVGARSAAVPACRMSEWRRAADGALAPYHAGRLATYAALGAMAAAVIGGAARFSGWTVLSTMLLGGAALLFLVEALRRFGLLRHAFPARAGGVRTNRLARIAAPLFAAPTGWRGFGLGAALGFLPCGLLYGALAASASAADPLAGAAGMAAFALGTMPALIGVGIAGQFAATRWRPLASRLAPLVLTANALFLGALAWRMAT